MNLQEVKLIIDEFGISMPKLAEKIGISDSSFKKKIEPLKYEGYKFSDSEMDALENAVLSLKERISIAI